jgi:hypothetical protein
MRLGPSLRLDVGVELAGVWPLRIPTTTEPATFVSDCRRAVADLSC